MTTWALVIFLLSGFGGGATTVDGFQSREACEEAATAIKHKPELPWYENRSPTEFETFCVEVKR